MQEVLCGPGNSYIAGTATRTGNLKATEQAHLTTLAPVAGTG